MKEIPINQIICVHWVEGFKQLPDESIDMIFTSPPYWLMRNYHLDPIIFDGLPDCDHEWGPGMKIKHRGSVGKSSKVISHKKERQGRELNQGNFCEKCGAWRGQLGSEPNPELYIQHLMQGFIEAKRVLRSTGACWVNIGDKRWNAKGNCFNPGGGKHNFVEYRKKRAGIYPLYRGNKSDCPGLKEKSLAAIPERFMLAMLEIGWTYRQRGCWLKSNHKPDGVKDRLTDCWEPLYFFVKSKKYFFDLDAIRIPHKDSSIKMNHPLGKNPGDVFLVSYRKVPGIKHFSTFPEELLEIPIKACCPSGGIVLDPFMGSGTTAAAARKLSRNYIGFELSKEYIKIAEKRLLKLE